MLQTLFSIIYYIIYTCKNVDLRSDYTSGEEVPQLNAINASIYSQKPLRGCELKKKIEMNRYEISS